MHFSFLEDIFCSGANLDRQKTDQSNLSFKDWSSQLVIKCHQASKALRIYFYHSHNLPYIAGSVRIAIKQLSILSAALGRQDIWRTEFHLLCLSMNSSRADLIRIRIVRVLIDDYLKLFGRIFEAVKTVKALADGQWICQSISCRSSYHR